MEDKARSFSLRGRECSKTDSGDGCTCLLTFETTELYTFNGWITCYVYYISIELFKKNRALKPDCLPSSVSTAIAVQHRASYFTSTKFFLISPICTKGTIMQIKSLDCCEYYKRAHVKSFPQRPAYTVCSVSVNNWQGLEAQMSSSC